MGLVDGFMDEYKYWTETKEERRRGGSDGWRFTVSSCTTTWPSGSGTTTTRSITSIARNG